MSQNWYVKHNGKTFGPISSGKLKQLAGAAKIKPATQVRLGEGGHWAEARRVKGLLPGRATPQEKPSHQQVRLSGLKPSQPGDSRSVKHAHDRGARPYRSPIPTEESQSARPVADTQEMQMTRAGLFAVYYGICAVLFAIGVGSLLWILGASMGNPLLMVLAGGVASIAGLGGYIAILVGQILCLTVPRESGSKGHVQIAVAIQALSILLAIGYEVIEEAMGASGSVDPVLIAVGSVILSLVNSAMVLVGYVCFLYFIRHLALYIGRNDLASSSSVVMKLIIVAVVMLVVCPVTAAMAPSVIPVPGIGMLVSIVVILAMAITFLIAFIRYANLVGYLARAISK